MDGCTYYTILYDTILHDTWARVLGGGITDQKKVKKLYLQYFRRYEMCGEHIGTVQTGYINQYNKKVRAMEYIPTRQIYDSMVLRQD